MNVQLKLFIRVFTFLPFVVLGTGWMSKYPIMSLSFFISGGIIVAGIAIAALIGGKATNYALLVSSLTYSILIGEGVSYVLEPKLNSSGFDKSCTEFDPIRGYRWTEDTIRCFRVRSGEVVYDNHFYPNNVGWIMDQDYAYKKKDTLTSRWMLLGDSFVAGIMLENNLPNKVQDLINDSIGKDKVELYSFGVDGGGIMNWYNVFFKEIIPNYEFDGIIIAPYADNLYRDFMVMIIQENGFMGRIDSVDWKDDDVIYKEDFKSLKPYSSIYSNSEIDHLLTSSRKPFNWPLKKNIYRFAKGLTKKPKKERKENVTTIDQLNVKMGEKKSHQLTSILSWCSNNGKNVILASIPSKHELKNQVQEKNNQHKLEMEIIANTYQLSYFDGYAVFDGMNEMEIDQHWLNYDGHWNQKGSDLYASYFADYLLQVNQDSSLIRF